MNRLGIAVTVLVLGFTVVGVSAAPFSSYHVGNSFTNNLLLGGQLSALSAARGQQHTWARHTLGNTPLNYFWANPDEREAPWQTPFYMALPTMKWNAVTLQPSITGHSTIPSTLGSDIQVINDMIALARTNPLNTDTQFFIYAAWPAKHQYEADWLRAASSDPSQVTILARAYFDILYDAVTADHPGVRMIPGGETLYAVDQRIRQGGLAGLTSIGDLYADNVHLNELGSHLVAAAAYATLFGDSPIGLPYTGPVAVMPETLHELQTIVWDVVRSQSYTGVPEPTSLAGLVAGAVLLLRRSRRA